MNGISTSGASAWYRHLGTGAVFSEDYDAIDVKLNYSARQFAARDRFGRVLDQIWTDYGEDPAVVLDHYTSTYARAGNRRSRGNALHSPLSKAPKLPPESQVLIGCSDAQPLCIGKAMHLKLV